MADNNLWLRHLLNLVVQVGLAAYVFWKSDEMHSMQLLVSGVLVFVAGVIKYGERTWSLKCGRFKSLESSTGKHYNYKKGFPEAKDSDYDYTKTLLNALSSMQNVHNVFAARNPFLTGTDSSSSITAPDAVHDTKKLLKVVELELAMIYDDLYKKALVLRTRIGIILRCIAHTCSFVAFAFFITSDKQRYNRVDVAITYSLFIGAIFLDLSSMFIFIMSPWTWVWLKALKCNWLASLSWFLFSSDIGWPEKRPRWSNSIGQYDLLSWVSGGDNKPRSCNQQVMFQVRKLVSLVGVGKENLFWMSKILDTKNVEADEKIMEFVVKGISQLRNEFSEETRQQWPNLSPLLKKIRIYYVVDIGCAILVMHIFTTAFLNSMKHTTGGKANDMVEVCRKLSNYMMYLFVNNPSMLPLNASSEATVAEFAKSFAKSRRELSSNLTIGGLYKIIEKHLDDEKPSRGTLEELYKMVLDADVKPSEGALEEMAAMWLRLLIFSAGRSNGKVHAAELAKGGELITFTWLLMAREGLGESESKRVRMTSTISFDDSAGADTDLKEAYAFFFPG
uniref:DUF4220 domain-containing protein n=1 Tax=Leersia perrieri TaxID=77586 RepID=A0A0D9WW63_9ORYZ